MTTGDSHDTPEPVTAEQVKAAMIANGIWHVPHHECALCGYMTRYYRCGEDLVFDPGCFCTGLTADLQVHTWQDAADLINMQTNDAARSKFRKRFGLDP